MHERAKPQFNATMLNEAHGGALHIQSPSSRPAAFSPLGIAAHEVTVVVIVIVVIWLFHLIAQAIANPETKAKHAMATALPVEHRRRRARQPSSPASAATCAVWRSPTASSMPMSTRQAPSATRPALSRRELRAALDLARAEALPSRSLSSGSLFYANVVGNTKPSAHVLPRRRSFCA